MERLTERHDHGIKMAAGYDFGIDPDDYDLVQKILAKLAAYEDTGLEPEEVKDMAENAETRLLTWCESRYGFPVGTVMDLLEAKQQGRLAVLPCKIGDTVWFETFDTGKNRYIGIQPHKIVDFRLDMMIERKMGRPTTFLPYDDFGKYVFLTKEEAEAALAADCVPR